MKKHLLLLLFLSISFVSFSFVKRPAKSSSKAVSRAIAFPVAGKRGRVGSYWGADRDGGRRKHKGIDIFAKKGTPVVAITDGVIVAREHTTVGGKTLWLRSASHPWTAYYAHLNKQLVKEGQWVRKGQVLGTVGNTGNARTTPSHLHFGIYTAKGPVNPLPYVKKAPRVVAKATKTKKTTTAKSVRHRKGKR